jgi:TIGR03009 family protein
MQQILQDWETQSGKLKTLEVSLYRIDTIPAWNDVEHFVGQAAFKTPQLAFLDFRKVKMQKQADPKDPNKQVLAPVKKNGQVVSTPFQTVLCTDKEIWEYRSETKQILIFPLDRDARKRAIEEGPLPFLFNMRAAEAVQRYKVALQAEDPKTYLVRIVPLWEADQQSFSIAWVYLDREFLLPRRIFLLAPDKKSSKDFHLSNIRANKPVDSRKFVGVDPGKGWKIERNPAQPAAAPARANARTRQNQPAQAAQRPDDNPPRQ